MDILRLPKIDGHCHVLDPQRFPYAPDVGYHPQGQEVGDARCFSAVMDCHGVRHALLVGPNSGYGLDNRCLLDAIAQGGGRFKGVAVLPNDCGLERLQQLQAQGIVGVAFNAALHGEAHFADIEPLLLRLRQLGLWAQFQVQNDQLPFFLPMIERSQVRVMVDHCGRPDVARGLAQPGFQALLALGRTGQAVVKLSGPIKFSGRPFPFDDVAPYAHALAGAFGLGRCIWASDWPYLKAPYRLDYGPMLGWFASLFTPSECQQIMWDTPKALLFPD